MAIKEEVEVRELGSNCVGPWVLPAEEPIGGRVALAFGGCVTVAGSLAQTSPLSTSVDFSTSPHLLFLRLFFSLFSTRAAACCTIPSICLLIPWTFSYSPVLRFRFRFVPHRNALR